ncbi:MAG: TetR/AcrR family transcriptional regulator C-terminal domain-containing protein [Solirubrobacterales bacterium]|nr:TetR/AcrR family transcriptional regulator C-terminal domain-containing protein [Solirubrobacterales bacterium]
MASDHDRRGRRRPSRTQLSRDDIVQAALEIAAEEGIKNVSMRKVARRLDAGTMSLYHYVRTKDDLLALMDDAIMGEIVIPEGEMPDGWRERVTLIAKLSLAAWMKRPWLIDEEDQFRITENGMRHMEQSMGALEGLDISAGLKFEIMGQVDDYLFGYAVRERAVKPENLIGSEEFEEVADFVEDNLRSGDYPHLASMFDSERTLEEQWVEMLEDVYDDERFERGLNRLLDGVEAELIRLGALP